MTGYTPPDWVTDAACNGHPPYLWFPQQGQTNSKAIAICNGCPVKHQCLEHALETPERFGIWGGVSERQRRLMRIRRRRIA